MFGICFGPSKSETLAEGWIGSKVNHVLTGGKLSELDRFNYLSSCISPGGRILDELSMYVQKAP